MFDDGQDVQDGSQFIQTTDGLRLHRWADLRQKRPETSPHREIRLESNSGCVKQKNKVKLSKGSEEMRPRALGGVLGFLSVLEKRGRGCLPANRRRLEDDRQQDAGQRRHVLHRLRGDHLFRMCDLQNTRAQQLTTHTKYFSPLKSFPDLNCWGIHTESSSPFHWDVGESSSSYLLDQMSHLHNDDSKHSRKDPAERGCVPGLSHLEEICQTGDSWLTQLQTERAERHRGALELSESGPVQLEIC